ncbi:MAG: MFS transporter [Cytophagia bacterium]|nr:MAG: MFS transporter [Runella sp.]TAG24421.1 MAG: MFS transporter [Cytophagales bacterium]TAG35237.1 MAG: MFS transporter [Cytophagia bacterium]TAG58597.1 MAG: MFS transporter [Runella slithyformis]TAG77148.1 MAG: MFS transporter [Cytophagales bacterium]
METSNQSLRRAWYVVAVLMLAYISSFIDRQVLTLLVKPLKRDFQISDTQYGLLVGLSFALFYTFLGVPIGRMADRQNRKRIIVWGIMIWSIMTALCGVTQNYNQLFLARIGVGIGEAALSPAAYSLITDLFPRHKLGTALGIYNIGVYLGSGLSILLVAVILKLINVEGTWTVPFFGEIFPWQSVFFIVGLPGILIVLLIVLTVREPARQNQPKEAVPIADIWAYFLANRTAILCLFIGIAFMAFGSYSVTSWTPALLERRYGLTASQGGLLLGGIVTVFSTAGVLFGGRYGDQLTKRGIADAKMRVGYLGMRIGLGLAVLLLSCFALNWAPLPFFVVMLALMCFFTSMPYGSATAAVQEMIPAPMRATFSALFLFCVNLIGLAGGPSMVGLLNDKYFNDPNQVHLSLGITIVFGCAMSSFLLRRGLKPFVISIKNAQMTTT